eukprot:gene3715-biopygen5397
MALGANSAAAAGAAAAAHKWQGYRRSAFVLGANRVEMAKLRALYSASRSFRVAYRASPSSACAKGSPGRRGASLCAPSAQDTQAAEQAVQLMIATSPIVFSSTNASDTGGVRVIYPPGHQGPCETCIAFAVGAAAEAAVASVLRVNVLLVNVSVQSLYYCGPEDIYAYQNKQVVCRGRCTDVNAYSPMGRFDYVPIRDIWAAQRHIRHYGGVVSSFYVYDDFETFFSNFATSDKVYRPGPKAQSMFGHAVLLVGYVNTEDGGHWIVKNSYGNIWGDNGFFRVAFGVCSILMSDGEAFGVVWVPLPSPVSKVPPLEVYKSSSSNCFWYVAKSGDYISRIAWIADIPVWQLLLDNTKAVVDLDAPLTGTTLLLCNPAQGRYKVLPVSAPPFTVQPIAGTIKPPPSQQSPPTSPPPSAPSGGKTFQGGTKEQFCSWSAIDSTCVLDLSIAQRSLKIQPATVWHKINLFRYDRQNHCAALKTEAACTASSAKYKCYWDGNDLDSAPQDRNFCYSNDFILGKNYRDTIGQLPAPEFLACAGSKAREFMRCHQLQQQQHNPGIQHPKQVGSVAFACLAAAADNHVRVVTDVAVVVALPQCCVQRSPAVGGVGLQRGGGTAIPTGTWSCLRQRQTNLTLTLRHSSRKFGGHVKGHV